MYAKKRRASESKKKVEKLPWWRNCIRWTAEYMRMAFGDAASGVNSILAVTSSCVCSLKLNCSYFSYFTANFFFVRFLFICQSHFFFRELVKICFFTFNFSIVHFSVRSLNRSAKQKNSSNGSVMMMNFFRDFRQSSQQDDACYVLFFFVVIFRTTTEKREEKNYSF